MFSWIDYIENENYQNKPPEKRVKILKKSISSQLMPEKTFSNVKRTRNHENKNKITVSNVQKTNSNQSNSCCKIIDLTGEEKAKLAQLIKELGQLQWEKEEISRKYLTEQNSYRLEREECERMQRISLNERTQLQKELQNKEERLSKLEAQLEVCKQSVEPKTVDIADEFVHVPKPISDSCSKSQSKIRAFPGPPKSSKSHEIKQDLFRSQSSGLNNLSEIEQRNQLSQEHERLLIEKHYLDVVLKQQKCLNHLKHKIKKLENKSTRKNQNPPTVESDDSSMRTLSRDCVTPTVLNDISDDPNSLIERSESVVSKSDSNSNRYSTESVDNCDKVDLVKPTLSIANSDCGSVFLPDEDLFIITTLNEDAIKSDERIYIATPVGSLNTNLASLRSHSPPNSLFDIISDLDEMDSDKSPLSDHRNSTFENLSDQEIFDDLFFNRLFH